VVGIDWEWLAGDGAMGKAPLGGAKTGPNPTDRAKRGRNVRFSARRRGSRSGWRTTAPTATTPKLLEPTLDSVPIERPEPTPEQPQGLCLDRGCDYPWVHELADERGFTPHIRARGDEIRLKLRTPGWRVRRWVVEACDSWLNRNRALLVRCWKKDDNHLALLQLACGLIAFKKARAAQLTLGLAG